MPERNEALQKILQTAIDAYVNKTETGGQTVHPENLIAPIWNMLRDTLMQHVECSACRLFYTMKFTNALLHSLGYVTLPFPPELAEHMGIPTSEPVLPFDLNTAEPAGRA